MSYAMALVQDFTKKKFADEVLPYFVLQKNIKTKAIIGKYVYLILQDIMQSNIFIYFWITQESKDCYRLWTDPLTLIWEKNIDNFECDACQKYKVDGRGFGHLEM